MNTTSPEYFEVQLKKEGIVYAIILNPSGINEKINIVIHLN